MRRTQIYLTDDEWSRLSVLSRDQGLSKAFLIREAVDQLYLSKPSAKSFSKALRKVYGLWSDRKDVGDAAAYVRKLRRRESREDYLRKQWRRSSSIRTS